MLIDAEGPIRSSGYYSAVDVSFLRADEALRLMELGYDFDPQSTLWLPLNLTKSRFDPNATGGASDIRPQCIYQFYTEDSMSLSFYLSTLLSGSITIGADYLGGPNVLLSLYDDQAVSFDSINSAFGRIAQSMTLFGRNFEKGFENATQGYVFGGSTCITVQWGWIAYPAALALGTLAFLVGTAALSSPDGWPHQDYKTSILPLMFHRLGESETPTTEADLCNMAGVRAVAEKMEVRFQNTDRGWRFVES